MGTLKKFISRRNSVTLNDDGRGLSVRKVFADRADFANEAMVYSLVEHTRLAAASVISKAENELVLSYLPGETFVELLERQETEGRADFAPWESLSRWLYDFHTLTGLVMGDMNLRNFLFDQESGLVAGLDFEQCRKGDFVEMAAGLCAYTLLYTPEMSDLKKGISAHLQEFFSERYSCDSGSLRLRTEACVERVLNMRRAKRAERMG